MRDDNGVTVFYPGEMISMEFPVEHRGDLTGTTRYSKADVFLWDGFELVSQ